MQSNPGKAVYEFGPFRLDPAEHTLLRSGQPVALAPKVFDILALLVEKNGHLFAKEELMQAVWPDSFVEEGNLTRNISTLRTALGEKTDEQYIETVPKRGYRFVARVKKLEGDNGDLVVKEHFKSAVAVEQPQGTSDPDHAERSFERDAGVAASQITVMNAGARSRAGPSALVSQSPSINASAAPLLKVTRRRVAAVLIGLVGIIAVLGYAFLFRSAQPIHQPEIKSLAVLPLKSVNKDPSDDYLGLPLADTIITRVSQISELTVRPTSAVRKYANQETSSLEAGRQLKVDSVLDGTVQRAGDRLRVNLNLLRVSDGASLWSESFDPNYTDILKMQDEVAQRVAARLRLKLRPQTQISSVSPEAYDLYLRAKYHAGLQNEPENEAAIALLERAVQIDPNFAAAYAELANEYRNMAFALKPQEREWEEKASSATERALLLNPDLAEAHVARGLLLWSHSNHFPHALAAQEFRRALDLNPNLDEAHHQLASVYNHIGLLDKAEEEIRKAVDINPGNTGARFRIGVNLLYQGRDEQALAAFDDSEKFNPAFWAYQTACALFHLGRKEEAAARVAEALKNNPQDEGGALSSIQALLAASTGDVAATEAKIKRAAELGKGFGHFHHTAYTIACAYTLLNKAEPAMKWLQMAADDGLPCYPLFERDPNLNNLRKDPRFITFMVRLKDQWEHYQATL